MNKHYLCLIAMGTSLLVSGCASGSYPEVGGVGAFPRFHFNQTQVRTLQEYNGVEIIGRAGDQWNADETTLIGAIFLVDFRNVSNSARCAKAEFSDAVYDGVGYGGSSVYGSGQTWLVKKGQTLRNVGQINHLQNYSKSPSRNSQLRIDDFEVWEPGPDGRC